MGRRGDTTDLKREENYISLSFFPENLLQALLQFTIIIIIIMSNLSLILLIG